MPGRGSRSRRWCVPPAVKRGPHETLEGAGILAELPGDLGGLLWRTAQDVRLWGEAGRDARDNLFTEQSKDHRLASLGMLSVPGAALDLAHSARAAGDLAGSTRAKREVLRLASDDVFPRISSEVTALWPDGQAAPEPLSRAS